MKESSTNTSQISTKMDNQPPQVSYNTGQQTRRPPSSGPPHPQKARTTSGSYPNHNNGGGPGGYPPQGQQNLQNNHQAPQFIQNGHPGMMQNGLGMYGGPFPGQIPFQGQNVVMTLPMQAYFPPQMQQRMPMGMPVQYGTSPGQAGFFLPPGAVLPAQFHNQTGFGPSQSGAGGPGFPMQQGSVSPNILTGPATGPPRFTAPDAVMAPGMHGSGASFVPRAPGVGQSPRLHWQTEPLYRAEQHRAELQRAEQHRASAPQPAAAPAAAPKTEPKKKTLLVFTNPDSGAAVDIPVKDEKSKAAGVTSANTSEPSSRQSSVSENAGEEKDKFQDAEKAKEARTQFALQMQAVMKSDSGSVQAVPKSVETESKGQIEDSPTVVKNSTGVTSSQQQQQQLPVSSQSRQQPGEARASEDATKGARSRTTSENPPATAEVPSVKEETARDIASTTASSKPTSSSMPSQPAAQPALEKVAEQPRRPSATSTPELKSEKEEPVKAPVDAGKGLGTMPVFRRSSVQDSRLARHVATPPPVVQEVRSVENVNGDMELEPEMEKLEKVAGRQTYDRSALLSLENKYMQGSMMGSDDLKNKVNSIIKKDGGGQGQGHRNDQFHGQGRGGGYDGPRGQQMPRVNSSRNFQQEEPPQRVITLNRDLNVIASSENAWKPNSKKEKVQIDSEDAEKEEIMSDVRALLNKISPNNYGKLSDKMQLMPFTKTGELLVGAVDVIFDKALDEQNYAELYARLCRKLIDLQVPQEAGADPTKSIKFRTVLLQRAQHYFEKTEREEQESDKEKEDADNDPVVVEQKRVKAKRHYVGNIRFISELYKWDMLTDKVILSCFGKLLPKRIDFTDADEEKMECLCKLLMTCAEKIANTASVKFFFDQLQKMIDLKVTSSRIRFLMQDAIDLKNNNFVQRKNAVQGLKTKEEVRKEKIQEEIQTKQETLTAIQQMPPPPMSQGRLPLGPDRNRLPPAHVQGGLKSVRTAPNALSAMPGAMGGRDNRQSGSMGQQQAAVKTSSVASKPSKFLSTYGQDRSGGQGGPVPTLGPPRWAGGSGALNPSRTSTPGGPLGNRMDNRSATNSRENSMSRGEQRNSLTNTPDMRVGTSTLSLEPSSNLSSPQMTPAATPRTGSPVNLSIPDETVEDLVSVPDEGVEDLVGNPDEEVEDLAPVSDEGVEDFTQRLVTAILNTEETEMEEGIRRASNRIARLSDDQTAQFIVNVAGNMYNEAKKPDRVKYGSLFLGLAKAGRLTPEILANGFGQLAALTEDQVVDVPQYRDYVVDMLAPLVVADLFPLDRLDDVFGRSTVEGDVEKYHSAFRSWLQGPDRISAEEKKVLVNKDPGWAKLLQ